MNNRFIRLEATKLQLTGTYLYIASIDERVPYLADGSADPDYGQLTITGVGTDFTGQLADGDVIQLCSDATLFENYGVDSTSVSRVLGTAIDYKFSMQFETILEEYEVVSRASTTSMVVKPYTTYSIVIKEALERGSIYLKAYKDEDDVFQPLRFSTFYKKNLVNSKTNDYIVNIDDIKYFKINASSAQNMDVVINSGNSASTTLAVHNCFDYLNYILQPYTQLEQQRIFYEYAHTNLTGAQPNFYSNYVYVKSEEYRKEKEENKEKALKSISNRRTY
jgi:hypothetical protein